MVYIASAVPFRTWPFDPAKPGFYVEELPSSAVTIKQHFSKAYVYCAGAYEKCGCGFQYGREDPEFQTDAEQLAAANECRAGIEAYLKEALRTQSSVEVYACWAGEESQQPTSRRSMEVPSFPNGFVEREFLVVGDAVKQ